MNRTACFYAPVASREVLDRVAFYSQDIACLKSLGFDVIIATRWHEIRTDVDLFYVWWWTWAFVPLLRRGLRRTPMLITGVFDYRWPSPGLDYVNRPWWQRILMRWALRSATANVFITDFEHDEVTRHLQVSNPSVIRLSVDTTLYKPLPGSRRPFVFSIGWLHEPNARRKGMFELVRAFALVQPAFPHLRLVIAGATGSGLGLLQQEAHDLGVADAVEWRGPISEGEKIQLLQQCVLYAQPTLYEGFGLAILEAMACGAPVLTCAGGATTEVLGSGGLLVPRDVGAIATGMCRLLEDPDEAAELGAAARARALTFSSHQKREQLQHVVDGLLGGGPLLPERLG